MTCRHQYVTRTRNPHVVFVVGDLVLFCSPFFLSGHATSLGDTNKEFFTFFLMGYPVWSFSPLFE